MQLLGRLAMQLSKDLEYRILLVSMSGAKRKLAVTLSDDLRAIETAATSERSCRRKKAEARNTVHTMPASRLGIGQAVSDWPLSQQEGLFFHVDNDNSFDSDQIPSLSPGAA